jgi:hypothetical protein
MENIPKKTMTIQTIVFHCDFSNIQKCSFKECPFTCVAPLIVFLPIWNLDKELKKHVWDAMLL